jgi:hypothetical protein
MKIISIAGLGWLPIIAVSLWWAGFAPFPTKPVTLASYQFGDACTVNDQSWARCSPGLSSSYPQGSLSDFRLFPDVEPDRRYGQYGQYGQWGVEGMLNNCWDEGCRTADLGPGVNAMWKIYYTTEVPHFGLGAPKWVLVLGGQTSGNYAEATYATYSACMYRKPADAVTAFYWCKHIEAGDPWHVGRIHQ